MALSPLGLTPLLQVFDMVNSLAFYRDLLGFEVVSASPEVETAEGRFSHWMWLKCGPVELMLNTQYDSNERPDRPNEARAAAHRDTSLYIGCADIDAAYKRLSERGLKADPPRLARYGLRLFDAIDPDGYAIIFQEARQPDLSTSAGTLTRPDGPKAAPHTAASAPPASSPRP